MKPTKAMLEQMLQYCNDITFSGSYWGNRDQFEKRHEKIINWLKEQQEKKSEVDIA